MLLNPTHAFVFDIILPQNFRKNDFDMVFSPFMVNMQSCLSAIYSVKISVKLFIIGTLRIPASVFGDSLISESFPLKIKFLFTYIFLLSISMSFTVSANASPRRRPQYSIKNTNIFSSALKSGFVVNSVISSEVSALFLFRSCFGS